MLVGLAVLVVAAASGVWSAYHKQKESAALRAQAEAQLADLSQRQTQLNSDIGKLETNRGQEEVLRDQYALAAKGEGLIVIVNPTTTAEQATSSAFAQWIHNTFPWW
jgi:cell division protein FtsB